jgi:hypothetical protein
VTLLTFILQLYITLYYAREFASLHLPNKRNKNMYMYLIRGFIRSETLQWFEMDAGTSSKHKLVRP